MLTVQGISKGAAKSVTGYPVKRVVLFGSYAENRQTEQSDVDLLVEFTSAAVSLLTLSRLRMDIAAALGADVDLIHAPLPEDSYLSIGKTVVLYDN